jgi:hypothetical protein
MSETLEPPRASNAMTSQELELAPRSDGARYRRVTLRVTHDGVVTLKAHEMGADRLAPWGLDDEEVTLSVAADQLARLALALAAELLDGGHDAVARLARICQDHDLPCRIACWS